MRKDIELHITTGDVTIVPQNEITLRKFTWLTALETGAVLSDNYVYGEIQVPNYLSKDYIRENGLYVKIPYTPVFKELVVRIKFVDNDGEGDYLVNRRDGSMWFAVKSAKYGGALQNAYVSLLPEISEDSFYIRFVDGYARIYAGSKSDFNIVKADHQNANCLLACRPGSNYRYPLTGVGLVRWINATDVSTTGLPQILLDEFSADGVTIKDAVYNFDTKQMELSLDVPEENE